MERPSKPCAVCGRVITWRRKWEKNWEDVRYCSDACRRRKLRPEDERLEQAILRLLLSRPAGSSICPSEAARLVRPTAETWRELMEPARAAARRLTAAGLTTVTQKGHPVDPSSAKGPIRITLNDRKAAQAVLEQDET